MQEILHLCSLLHALELQCLRLDPSLDNLITFNRLDGFQYEEDSEESKRHASRPAQKDLLFRALASLLSSLLRYISDRWTIDRCSAGCSGDAAA